MSEDKKITIVTHNSNFHSDDVFAVATLLHIIGDKNIEIIRSRDNDVIEKANYVVDVGGIYDPSTNRFDHHQVDGAGKRENTIPYASFGLVWKEYGAQISGSAEVAQKIDKTLVQCVDAIDIGIDLVEPRIPDIFPYTIADFVGSFMPSWKEEVKNYDEVFLLVVDIAKDLLTREIKKYKNKLEANSIVEEIYKNSVDKRLIVLDRYYPTSEVLSKYPEPLFVVGFRDDGKWDLVAIRKDPKFFANRKDLPQEWAGKRDAELETITGVEGATFCHNARFLIVAKTKEAILKLAEIALNS
ncbi:MAG TPA: MYG1 family protein [Candidatus Paceibacterota bacterium]